MKKKLVIWIGKDVVLLLGIKAFLSMIPKAGVKKKRRMD